MLPLPSFTTTPSTMDALKETVSSACSSTVDESPPQRYRRKSAIKAVNVIRRSTQGHDVSESECSDNDDKEVVTEDVKPSLAVLDTHKCKLCSIVILASEVVAHAKSHFAGFQCNLCLEPVIIDSTRGMRGHIRMKHGHECMNEFTPVGDKKSDAEMVNACFENVRVRVVDRNHEEKCKSPAPAEKKQIAVKIEKGEFPLLNEVLKHSKAFKPTENIKCALCTAKIQMRNVTSHLYWHCKSGSPFQCSLCDAKFNLQYRVTDHLKKKHNYEGGVVDITSPKLFAESMFFLRECFPLLKDALCSVQEVLKTLEKNETVASFLRKKKRELEKRAIDSPSGVSEKKSNTEGIRKSIPTLITEVPHARSSEDTRAVPLKIEDSPSSSRCDSDKDLLERLKKSQGWKGWACKEKCTVCKLEIPAGRAWEHVQRHATRTRFSCKMCAFSTHNGSDASRHTELLTHNVEDMWNSDLLHEWEGLLGVCFPRFADIVPKGRFVAVDRDRIKQIVPLIQKPADCLSPSDSGSTPPKGERKRMKRTYDGETPRSKQKPSRKEGKLDLDEVANHVVEISSSFFADLLPRLLNVNENNTQKKVKVKTGSAESLGAERASSAEVVHCENEMAITKQEANPDSVSPPISDPSFCSPTRECSPPDVLLPSFAEQKRRRRALLDSCPDKDVTNIDRLKYITQQIQSESFRRAFELALGYAELKNIKPQEVAADNQSVKRRLQTDVTCNTQIKLEDGIDTSETKSTKEDDGQFVPLPSSSVDRSNILPHVIFKDLEADEERSGVLKCALCEDEVRGVDLFIVPCFEHVKLHASRPNFQCSECGVQGCCVDDFEEHIVKTHGAMKATVIDVRDELLEWEWCLLVCACFPSLSIDVVVNTQMFIPFLDKLRDLEQSEVENARAVYKRIMATAVRSERRAGVNAFGDDENETEGDNSEAEEEGEDDDYEEEEDMDE